MQALETAKPATAGTVNRLQLSGGKPSQRKQYQQPDNPQPETALAAAFARAIERKAVGK